MWSILVSAARWVLSFLLRGVVIKFVVLTGLAYIISWIVESVLDTLDISPLSNLGAVIAAIPPSILYFLSVFRVDVGLPLVLGAMLTKFLIRRIPLIG